MSKYCQLLLFKEKQFEQVEENIAMGHGRGSSALSVIAVTKNGRKFRTARFQINGNGLGHKARIRGSDEKNRIVKGGGETFISEIAT